MKGIGKIIIFTRLFMLKEPRLSKGLIALLLREKNPYGSIVTLNTSTSHSSSTSPLDDPSVPIIGNSQEILLAITLAKKTARVDFNVLLTGETGTGKDLFSRYIHNNSNRKNQPYVTLNCAAIPKELIISELFGYEEGAFTGASKKGKPGKFEAAHTGTLFLDEIGDMSLEGQLALLRVLEDKQVTRLGSNISKEVDVRVICATNKDLKKESESGNFRQDLYYRLNEINISIPPLRLRGEDIIVLFNHFIEKIFGRKILVSEEAKEALLNYNYPGNIRELSNIVKRIFINNEEIAMIKRHHLPKEIIEIPLGENHLTPFLCIKRNQIEDILHRCNGNISESSKLLGINRRTLYRKITEYNISIEKFRKRA
ncbi:MAG: sigma 54-interacting transcriptional regulator [Peptococcaceae bacterium]|nr:sigma 54-interacting transcriptional regulator [Peptococcaceae bacterium]